MQQVKKKPIVLTVIVSVLLVIGIVLVSGLLICVASTWFVVNRLLSLDKDDLYY